MKSWFVGHRFFKQAIA